MRPNLIHYSTHFFPVKYFAAIGFQYLSSCFCLFVIAFCLFFLHCLLIFSPLTFSVTIHNANIHWCYRHYNFYFHCTHISSLPFHNCSASYLEHDFHFRCFQYFFSCFLVWFDMGLIVVLLILDFASISGCFLLHMVLLRHSPVVANSWCSCSFHSLSLTFVSTCPYHDISIPSYLTFISCFFFTYF